jgi:hypothetical protein
VGRPSWYVWVSATKASLPMPPPQMNLVEG